MTEAIARDSLAYLFSVPQKTWIDVGDGRLVGFLLRGLLLSDDDGGPFTGLRRRDEQLADLGWLPAAAVYHFATRFRGGDLNLAADDVEEFGDLAAASDAAARRFVERHGRRRRHFTLCGRTATESSYRSSGGRAVCTTLWRLGNHAGLRPIPPLTLEQLAVLLYEVFGCRGYAPPSRDRGPEEEAPPRAPCTPSRPTRWCVTSKAWLPVSTTIPCASMCSSRSPSSPNGARATS